MDIILTTREVADILKVSPSTVRQWLKWGKLPGAKVGRHWRVRREDIDSLFARTGTGTPRQ